MPIKINGNIYFSLQEVASLCSKTPQTIRRWYTADKIVKPKKHSSSGRLLFSETQKDDVLAYANGLDDL